MKKYVKPELVCESFEMSQQIAACEYDSYNTSMDVETCGFTGSQFGESITIFTLGNGFCSASGEDFCYHEAVSGFSLFNS